MTQQVSFNPRKNGHVYFCTVFALKPAVFGFGLKTVTALVISITLTKKFKPDSH